MTSHFDEDLTRLMGELDNVPPAQFPGAAAVRKRGESRARHQAIGGTFAAVAVAGAAGALVFGQSALFAGPQPADPSPAEVESPEPTPTESTAVPGEALLGTDEIWDYGGTETIEWHQNDLNSSLFECVPDLDGIDARARGLNAFSDGLEGTPVSQAMVVHNLFRLDPDTADGVFADLQDRIRACAPVENSDPPRAMEDTPLEGIGDEAWIFRYLDPMDITDHPAGDRAGAYVTIGLVRTGDVLSVTARLEVNTESNREPDYMTPALAADKACREMFGDTCLERGMIAAVQATALGWYPVTINGEDAPEPGLPPSSLDVPEADGWERVSSPEHFNADVGITAADDTVIVLNGRSVWMSTDGGATWHSDATAVETGSILGGEAGLSWQDVVAADDGTLVAVGRAWTEESEVPVAARSTDNGRTWSGVVVDEAGGAVAEAATWTGEEFVAVGAAERPTGWRSDDGIEWARITRLGEGTPAIEGALYDVVADANGDPIALGGVGDSSYSVTWSAEDGSDWQEHGDLPAEVGSLASTPTGVYAGGAIRAAGDVSYDGSLLTSADGIAWEIDPRSEALAGAGDQSVWAVDADADGRIALAGSSDGSGAVWVADSPQAPLERVGGPLFDEVVRMHDVFEGPDGLIAISSPGVGFSLIWREVD